MKIFILTIIIIFIAWHMYNLYEFMTKTINYLREIILKLNDLKEINKKMNSITKTLQNISDNVDDITDTLFNYEELINDDE